jgi:hypothetical protein
VLGTLGQAYARAGRRQERLRDELVTLSRHSYVPPHAMVHIYIALGDRDKAFEWMEKSYQERSNSMVWLANGGKLFEPLKSDPRFDI